MILLTPFSEIKYALKGLIIEKIELKPPSQKRVIVKNIQT